MVRTLGYSLPAALHDVVDLVMPTTMFPVKNALGMGSSRSVVNPWPGEAVVGDATVRGPAGQVIDASCNTTITPTCLMQLYRTEGYVPQAANKGNRIGITGYLEQVRIAFR